MFLLVYLMIVTDNNNDRFRHVDLKASILDIAEQYH